MRNLTRITHLLLADIEEGRKLYQAMFWHNLNIDYVEIAYREFDRNLTLITKSIIDKGPCLNINCNRLSNCRICLQSG